MASLIRFFEGQLQLIVIRARLAWTEKAQHGFKERIKERKRSGLSSEQRRRELSVCDNDAETEHARGVESEVH